MLCHFKAACILTQSEWWCGSEGEHALNVLSYISSLGEIKPLQTWKVTCTLWTHQSGHSRHYASPFFFCFHSSPSIKWLTGFSFERRASLLWCTCCCCCCCSTTIMKEREKKKAWIAASSLHYVFAVHPFAGWWHGRTWAEQVEKGVGWNPVGVCQ